jgi:hypothetical protein
MWGDPIPAEQKGMTIETCNVGWHRASRTDYHRLTRIKYTFCFHVHVRVSCPTSFQPQVRFSYGLNTHYAYICLYYDCHLLEPSIF